MVKLYVKRIFEIDCQMNGFLNFTIVLNMSSRGFKKKSLCQNHDSELRSQTYTYLSSIQ